MNPLIVFEQLGIQINWQTVLLGWDGPLNYPRQIHEKDVISYALRCMESDVDLAGPAVELASLTAAEYGEVDRLLRLLGSHCIASVEIGLL